MEIRELRLNNWVYSLQIGEYVQISSIDSEFVTLKAHVMFDHVYADMIEPIPLTEEILLKCGFDKFLKGIKCSDIYDTYRLGFFQIENHYGIYVFHGVEIKHLHQLQNLYFALTGEELKIEL